MVITFYKVARSSELANAEAFSWEKYRVRFLWSSGHSIFFRWPIHNHGSILLLFKDSLFHIYRWFINIELVANSAIAHAGRKLTSHACCLCQAPHGPVARRNTRQHFSPTFGGHLKQQNHQRKAQTHGKGGSKEALKRTFVYSRRWNKKADRRLIQPRRERAHVSQFLPLCTGPQRMTDAPPIPIWGFDVNDSS